VKRGFLLGSPFLFLVHEKIPRRKTSVGFVRVLGMVAGDLIAQGFLEAALKKEPLPKTDFCRMRGYVGSTTTGVILSKTFKPKGEIVMRSFVRCCSVALLFCTLLASSARAGIIRVPSSPVLFYADGGGDEAFFDVTLSGVPAGFTVENGLYAGYCVSFFDAESPTGMFHPARLYDSTGHLPGDLATLRWDYINYVLNHKQGTADDVQAAIWFFTDNITEGLTVAAQAMIDDALANGANYVPPPGGIVAVVVVATDIAELQTIIIEVPVPPTNPNPCDDRVTGGGWIITTGGAKGNFGVRGGIQNGQLWGGLNYIDHGTKMHVHSTGITSYVVVNPTTRRMTYNVTVNGAPATATVTVTDNGEPGTRDLFRIELSTGYAQGGQLGGTIRRGGGGNIQLHKANCGKKTQAQRGIRR
jgi:hypothetical protein